MAAKPPPRDRTGKDVESVPSKPERSPMERFSDLARGLVNVSREDFKREEERYAIKNAARKNEKKASDV